MILFVSINFKKINWDENLNRNNRIYGVKIFIFVNIKLKIRGKLNNDVKYIEWIIIFLLSYVFEVILVILFND